MSVTRKKTAFVKVKCVISEPLAAPKIITYKHAYIHTKYIDLALIFLFQF